MEANLSLSYILSYSLLYKNGEDHLWEVPLIKDTKIKDTNLKISNSFHFQNIVFPLRQDHQTQ